MTSAELKTWMERHGWTAAQAGEQLGLDRATVFRYLKKEGDLPRWLALACAAIDAGLEPI